ncbi:DUF4245 domain-containing protein [Actinoplanes sp. N902-109]|uniref:DUF4245 domain-containing protein n=1 Tax=Actinoplanes sp. (strain N902-109) TaxID=649831 RepID=UPI0003295B8F|nr:DUF4245 domain-containing protein [Actinoplanes sp. N902-109]AGL20957.1 hypothetical protein L083_7447 [Actinoplanes sp. N902-109]
MSSAEAPVAPASRGDRRPRDMALSIGILIVPIALVLLFYRLVLDGDKPVSVDAEPALQEARTAAVFPVAEPRGLSDDWHVQSALFRRVDGGATLRLGYTAPDDKPLQLIESSVATTTLIPAELGKEPKAVGTVRAGSRLWQKYDARPGESALVVLEKGRTMIIVGSDRSENLDDLAAALP